MTHAEYRVMTAIWEVADENPGMIDFDMIAPLTDKILETLKPELEKAWQYDELCD